MKVDGTYIGGQAEGTRGRGAEKKTLVLVGVEGFPNKKLGRVRFMIVPSESSESIEKFVKEYVSNDATVVSDGLSASEAAAIAFRLWMMIRVRSYPVNCFVHALEKTKPKDLKQG